MLEESTSSELEPTVPAEPTIDAPEVREIARPRLSKEELLGVLKKYKEETQPAPLVLRELYDPKRLPFVTETPPKLIPVILRMEMILAATDPTRTRSLIEVFIEKLDTRMISYQRKGRLEILGALQALAESSDDSAVRG